MPELGGENPRFRVGYALPARKLDSFMLPPFIHHAKRHGIDFIPIDPSTPLTDQTPFDCILHKLYTHDWNLNLHRFSLRHPSAVVIDPPSAIQRLHNRISMLDSVTHLNIPHLNIPKQLLVHDRPSLIDTHDSDLDFDFPVIAKPMAADGSTKSHKMSLVLNREGLAKLEPPIVLQQFVNHGGVIFKVYVAGDYVKCVKRSSLPDISGETLGKMFEESGGVMCFSQISNSALGAEDRRGSDDSGEEVKMPAAEFVEEVAKGLREALGLRLFNFDMIRDDKGKGYLVIDINYFPGYEKLPCYESVMTDFLLNVLRSQSEKMGTTATTAAAEHGDVVGEPSEQ